MWQWSTSTFENSCGCTALDVPEWRETPEQREWREKQFSQVACVSEDLKCWGAWDTTCVHKANDITPSIAWRREAWKEEALDYFPWKDERGPSSIRRTLELFQRQRWESFFQMGWSAYGLFRGHRYRLEKKTEPRNAEMSSSRTAFLQNTSEKKKEKKRKKKEKKKKGQNTHEVKKNADFNQARQDMRKVFSGDTFLQQQTGR